MKILFLRLMQAMRDARTKDLTRHLSATPLEHIYARFGRDILAQAAQDRTLSDAIAREVAEIDRSLEEEGVDPTPVELRSFLMGYGQGVIDSAVIRPDLVAKDTSCGSVYPSSVVKLGALSQKAFAGGLIKMST
ncbi:MULTISPECIES: hypothetical protein [Nonomuraea]|uniref:Uncharacterized protein n=1 Tax=Nonomuraea mangrovi TaxID=2316207 RepID=A0ABW4TG84_9ACTN